MYTYIGNVPAAVCVDGYSGWLGVGMSGVQDGSAGIGGAPLHSDVNKNKRQGEGQPLDEKTWISAS